MKVEEAILRFTDHITTERRLAQGTVRYYENEVQDFGRYLSANLIDDINDISSHEVRNWQMQLLEQGIAPSTVARNLSALRAWFSYLRRQGWMHRDVMAKVRPPKQPQRLPIFFREGEAEHIYDDIFPHTFDGELHKLVLRMLYETGMRRSELAGLTLNRIDLSSRTIKVLGKRNKERIVPIEGELAAQIQHYLSLRQAVAESNPEAGDRLLLNHRGHPVSDGMIYLIVEQYMRPLSSAERTSPHIFRHTFATHLLEEGANIDAIKELLGHSNLGSTEIYTHVSRQHLKETYKHAHPRAQSSSTHKT